MTLYWKIPIRFWIPWNVCGPSFADALRCAKSPFVRAALQLVVHVFLIFISFVSWQRWCNTFLFSSFVGGKERRDKKAGAWRFSEHRLRGAVSVRLIEQSWCAHRFHFYASVDRVGVNADTASSSSFIGQWFTSVLYRKYDRCLPNNNQFKHFTERDIHQRSVRGWHQRSFGHGNAWMELGASWVCRLWIFGFFLRGLCSTGWSGLQGAGEPQLLHRSE